MKRFAILSLLIILVRIISFSQITLTDSIVCITPEQLKTTNLIFAEHSKLKYENYLLSKQVDTYRLDNQYLDSINQLQLQKYNDIVNSYENQITDLNRSLEDSNRSVKVWKIGGITIGVGLLLWLILK